MDLHQVIAHFLHSVNDEWKSYMSIPYLFHLPSCLMDLVEICTGGQANFILVHTCQQNPILCKDIKQIYNFLLVFNSTCNKKLLQIKVTEFNKNSL